MYTDSDFNGTHRRSVVLSLFTRWHKTSNRLKRRNVNNMGHRKGKSHEVLCLVHTYKQSDRDCMVLCRCVS